MVWCGLLCCALVCCTVLWCDVVWCILYTIYCILHTIYYRLYTTYDILYTILYNVLSTPQVGAYTISLGWRGDYILCTIYYILHKSVLSTPRPEWTPYHMGGGGTIYCIRYTIYEILYTMYYMLYTICYIYRMLYTIYHILYTTYYNTQCIINPKRGEDTIPYGWRGDYILYAIYYTLHTIYYIVSKFKMVCSR